MTGAVNAHEFTLQKHFVNVEWLLLGIGRDHVLSVCDKRERIATDMLMNLTGEGMEELLKNKL